LACLKKSRRRKITVESLLIHQTIQSHVPIAVLDLAIQVLRAFLVGYIVQINVTLMVTANKSYLWIAFFITTIFMGCNRNDIPEDWKGKRLYNMVDGRDWIQINSDNTFLLHEFIPNSDETFEFVGVIENMELVSSAQLTFQGRNDYKPTEISSKIEMMDIGRKFLRINYQYFNTITGKETEDRRNYTPENISPF